MNARLQTVTANLLAAIFLYAGFSKAVSCSSFYQDIRQFHLVSEGFGWFVAHYLPSLEIVIGLAMLWRETRISACLVSSFLLFVFICVIISAWIGHLNVDCGCFGTSALNSSYPWLIFRDLALLCAALYLGTNPSKEETVKASRT